jgi:hypothetical protein
MIGVVVLGMHRSGTSAVAGLLARLGIWPGPESDLMPAKPDNPEGFWELTDLVAVDDLILERGGEAWDVPFADPPERDLGGLLEQLDVILARLRAQQGPWLIKDPRLCLTWDVVGARCGEVVPLVVYRHPLDVALSLERRHNFPLLLGVALWEAYTRRLCLALERSRQTPLLVGFDDLRHDPGQTTDRLLHQLAERGVVAARPSQHQLDEWIVRREGRGSAAGVARSSYSNPVRASLCADFEAGRLPNPHPLSPDSRDALTLHRSLREEQRESLLAQHRLLADCHALWLEKEQLLEQVQAIWVEKNQLLEQVHALWVEKNGYLERLIAPGADPTDQSTKGLG